MVFEMFRTPIYSESDLEAARSAAVEMAREGDLENAEIRLRALAEYAKTNQKLWQDYLLILHWQGKNSQAITLLEKVEMNRSPDYFLEAMFNAARTDQQWTVVNNVAKNYLANQQVSHEQLAKGNKKLVTFTKKKPPPSKTENFSIPMTYWRTVDELVESGKQNQAKELLDVIAEYPELNNDDFYRLLLRYETLDSKKYEQLVNNLHDKKDVSEQLNAFWLTQQVKIAREGREQEALKSIGKHIVSQPGDKQARYEYITIAGWKPDDAKVLRASKEADLTNAPPHVVNTVAKSYRNTKQFDKAERLYRENLRKNPENEAARLGLAYTLQDMGAFKEAKLLLSRHDLLVVGHEQGQDKNDVSLQGYRANSFSGKNKNLQERINLHRSKGEWQLALALQEKILAKDLSEEQFKAWVFLNNKSYSDESRRTSNLVRLQENYPAQTWLRAETMYALSQKGEHKQALALLPLLNTDQLPEYQLESIAFSARIDDRSDLAYALYTKGETRFPNKLQFKLGRALVLSNMGKQEKAHKLLSGLYKQHPDNEAVQKAFVRSLEAQGKKIQVLTFYQAMAQRHPEKDWVYRKWVMSVASFGSLETAFELANQRSEALSKEDWKLLYNDRAAISIRWANLYEPSPEVLNARLERAQQFALEYQQFLTENYPEDKQSLFNAKNDELILLYRQKEYKKIIENYSDLKKSSFKISDESHLVAAEAYMVLGKHKEAAQVLKQTDLNSNRSLSLQYYVALSNFEHKKSLAIARKMSEKNSIWRSREGSKKLLPNQTRADADLKVKLMSAYDNDLEKAEKELEDFLSEGPANTEIRSNLANVYRWRGTPRKAEQAFNLIAATEPGFEQANIASTYNDIDLREYKKVGPKIAEIEKASFRSEGLKNLKQDWHIVRGPSLNINTSISRSKGSQFSSRDKQAEARINSSLFLERYRAYVRASYANNEQVKDVSLKRYGVGAQSETRNWFYGAELSQNVNGHDLGLGAFWDWFLNDHWTVSGVHQSYSDQTPIRAFIDDVQLKSNELRLSYARNESLKASIFFNHGSFTDGNTRQQIGANFFQSLFRSAAHQWDLRESLSLQTNDQVEASYFNPEQLAYVALGLDYTGTLRKYNSKSFKHSASFDLGFQNQKNSDSSFVWSFTYQHLWKFSKTFNIYYGGRYTQPVYDGETETLYSLFGGLNWNF